MKAPYTVLKLRPKLMISLTRDSVCAGDDCDAPHEKAVEAYSFSDPEALANALSMGYLPSIAGVGHLWDCVLNGIKIARIDSRGTHALIRECEYSEENKVHFVYHSAPW